MGYDKIKYTAIIDDVKYKSKPVGEYVSIVGRITNKGNGMHTLDEIKSAVENGKTLTPFRYRTHLSGKIIAKKNEYFLGTNLLMLDIDGSMTINDMISIHEKIGMKPNMYYRSFSHSESCHKFRVLYALPYMITTEEEYKLVWGTFNKLYFEGSVLDKTHDVSRMYFGTNTTAEILTYEPFDIARLADSVGTLISADRVGRVNLTEARLLPQDLVDHLSKVSDQEFYSSQMIRDFESVRLVNEGDYHKVRSLMFVYHYMGKIEKFYELASLNKPKYDRGKWESDLRNDLRVGRTGHTHTYQVLNEIGAFSRIEDSKNENIVVSNYLSRRLEVLQCYKELDIKIGKYIPMDKMMEILTLADSGKRILVIAPTGSGKTYTTIKSCENLGLKCVLSVPNRMNAQQNAEIYQIGGAFQGNSLLSAIATHKIVCSVWEMLGMQEIDFHNHILVNDEAHAHVHDSSYRCRSVQGIYRVLPMFKGVVDITATPTGLDLAQYTHIYQFVQDDQIEYKVRVYVGYNETQRAAIIGTSEGKALVLENRKKRLLYYKALFDSEDLGRVEIVTADDKDTNESFQSIAKEERLLPGTKFLLCTSVLTAGVNILDEDITDIVVVGIKNITTIKQFVARARKIKKANIHIFLPVGSQDYYTFNIYEERAYEAHLLEKRAVEIEDNIERDLLDSKSSLRRSKLKRDALQVEEDYQRLDEEVWRKYYTHLSITNFVTALREYFTDIDIISTEYEADLIAKDFIDSLSVDEDDHEIEDCNLVKDLSTDEKKSVQICLGYLESLPRGTRTKNYKRLKLLYPDVTPVDIRTIVDIDKLTTEQLDRYCYALGKGYGISIAKRSMYDQVDLSVIEDQVTAMMFMSDRNRYKKGSPAYVFIETIADRLPKDQVVSEEVMKELCERIDGRTYRENERWSNTVKEITKLVEVKKVRASREYEVGTWCLDEDLTTDVIARSSKIRHLESVDESVRKSHRERMKWLELADEFKSK